MTRLSRDIRDRLYSPDAEKVHTALITIDHADLDAPVRVTDGNTHLVSSEPEEVWGVTSNGVNYEFIAVSVGLPDDKPGELPTGSITLANNPDLVRTLRSFVTPPASVSIALVFADAPDLVYRQYDGFSLLEASGDNSTVTFSLRYDEMLGEMYGAAMTQPRFPGLFY